MLAERHADFVWMGFVTFEESFEGHKPSCLISLPIA